MAELSSCYFCGAALDTALERTQVATTGGDPTTVVLCPSCRRKLTAVLDRTLDADPNAESESLLGRAAGDAPATPANDDSDEGDDAPPVADVTPDQGSTTPDATDTERPTDLGTASSDGDAGASGGTSGATAVGGTDEPIFGADDAGGDEGESVAETTADATDEGAPFGSGTGAAGGPGEAATAVRDAEGADGTETPVRDAEPDATDESDDGGAADDAGGSPTPPDAETYNRVVRLLQNREFPVPRAEIEEVALNAYDIAPDDFRAVIDTAVERGVLAEDGDQLTLPD